MNKIELSKVEMELTKLIFKHAIDTESKLGEDILKIIDLVKDEQKSINEIKHQVSIIASKL